MERVRRANIFRPRGLRKFKAKQIKSTRGLVYFSHVPHGFYENEMRQFFTQFGKVTNINIPQSSVRFSIYWSFFSRLVSSLCTINFSAPESIKVTRSSNSCIPKWPKLLPKP